MASGQNEFDALVNDLRELDQRRVQQRAVEVRKHSIPIEDMPARLKAQNREMRKSIALMKAQADALEAMPPLMTPAEEAAMRREARLAKVREKETLLKSLVLAGRLTALDAAKCEARLHRLREIA